VVIGYLRNAVVALILLPFTGCELFSTRSPESPEGVQSNWVTPLESTQVLTNLSTALFERNAANYMRSFHADSFLFVADPQVQQQQPDVIGWSYSDEQQYIDRMFGEGVLPRDSVAFVVFTSVDQRSGVDTAHITTRYSLTAQVALSGAPGPMEGEAEFSLRIGDQGYWEIVRWTDRRTEELSSWSDLKALLSLR